MRERFPERMSRCMEGQRQAVLIELTRNRECRSAIEIKRDGESLQGRRVIFIHGAI